MKFHKIWYLKVFKKIVQKTQNSLKSDMNNWYFTSRPMYLYDISPNSSWNDVSDKKNYTENQQTLFMLRTSPGLFPGGYANGACR